LGVLDSLFWVLRECEIMPGLDLCGKVGCLEGLLIGELAGKGLYCKMCMLNENCECVELNVMPPVAGANHPFLLEKQEKKKGISLQSTEPKEMSKDVNVDFWESTGSFCFFLSFFDLL